MQNNTIEFAQISAEDPISQVIKQAFDLELNVTGGWGYDTESAIVIQSQTMPLQQLQHTIASMRTHLEMSMTLPEAERYGGINLNETARTLTQGYEVVTYTVSAMPESDYAKFITDYKEGYGTETFDMAQHFKDRAEATLKRDIQVWFRLDT